ncbi:MAG: family oxidoreductase [Bryobacterales bacterium]|nr:family oxidoreductase [Bryobacterales bacterium]
MRRCARQPCRFTDYAGATLGLLIHVSSAAGRVVVPAMAAYCATKFALEALADAYRFELYPFGIESVLVEPGIYRTPIFDQLMKPADPERSADFGGAGDTLNVF